MANLFETTFESGSVDSPINPTSEGFETSAGTATYDANIIAHGQYAAALVSSDGEGYFQWYAGGYPTGDFWGRHYLYIDQAISVESHVVTFWDGALQKASIVFLPDGRVSLRNASIHVDGVVSTVVWSPGTWMRLEWKINYSTDDFELWLYTDPDSTTEAVSLTFPAANGIPKWHRIRWGMSSIGFAVTGSYNTHIDNIALSQDGKIGSSPPDPVIPPSLVHTWTGGVTGTGAKIKAKTAHTSTLQLVYAIDPGTGDPLTDSPMTSPTATPDGNGMASFGVDALAPDTKYVYGFQANGELLSDRAHFTTMPQGAADFSVAFSAVQATGSDHAVFDSIRTQNPSLFFHLGGLYGTPVTVNNPDTVRARYDTQIQAGTGRFRNLLASIPVDYVWNDTDWGGTTGGQDNPAAAALEFVYGQYVPSYDRPDAGGALYHTVAIGRVQFIVLDVRTHRGASSLLGADQKQWLKDKLITPTYPLKVIACAQPWRSSSDWGNYPDEFAEINDYITDNNITGLLMIGAGNALAADSGANSGVNRANLIAGALDGPGVAAVGDWDHDNHANDVGAGQYGLLAVSDPGGSTITCTFTGMNQVGVQLTGPYVLTYTLNTHQAQVKRWNGSEWVLITPRVQLSSGWKVPPIRVWDGTAWRTI